jgi:hypothetical protein
MQPIDFSHCFSFNVGFTEDSFYFISECFKVCHDVSCVSVYILWAVSVSVPLLLMSYSPLKGLAFYKAHGIKDLSGRVSKLVHLE